MKKTSSLCFLALIALAGLAGCSGEEVGDDLQTLAGELLQSQIHILLLKSGLWAVLGAAAGFFFGLVSYFALRACGLFRLEWKHARWPRVLVCLILMGAGTFCLGWVGLFEGALRGGEDVLRKSQLARDVFPLMADAGADLIGGLALVVEESEKDEAERATEEQAQARLVAFQEGAWEIDVERMLAGVGKVKERFVEERIKALEARFREERPGKLGEFVDKLLTTILLRLSKALVERKLEDTIKKKTFGVGAIFFEIVDGLPAEAARVGDPKTISRKELSSYLVQRGIVPLMLKPLKKIVRGQQSGMLVLYALICGGLVILFWIAEMTRSRVAAKKAAAGAEGAVEEKKEAPEGEAPEV